MKVLILAAGYAMRLQPLTSNTPKSLLPVGGVALIDRILDNIAGLGEAGSIYIITNDKFFEKFKSWHEVSKHRKMISLINDGTRSNETRRGAIRDIEIAIEEAVIKDDLLIVAGDNLFDFDLKKFLRFARTHADGVSIALHDVKSLESAKKFGVVKIDVHNKIVDFKEKPQKPESTLISTGIYYIPKEKLPLIKEYTANMGEKADAPGHYIGWMAARDNVYGLAFGEDWCDIGDIESYKAADSKYSKNSV